MPLASPLRAGYAGSGNVRHKHGTEGLVGEVATQPLIRRPPDTAITQLSARQPIRNVLILGNSFSTANRNGCCTRCRE